MRARFLRSVFVFAPRQTVKLISVVVCLGQRVLHESTLHGSKKHVNVDRLVPCPFPVLFRWGTYCPTPARDIMSAPGDQ